MTNITRPSLTGTITEWVHEVIMGSGGLLDYMRYEWASYHGCAPGSHDKDEYYKALYPDSPHYCEAGMWVLDCLTNPEYASVLKAVNEHAQERLEVKG